VAETVTITGLRELTKVLRQADTELPKQLRIALNEAAESVAAGARKKVPKRSGRAAASYKARSTRTAARIAIGGRKAPYVPWLDFGGRTGINRSVNRRFYRDGRYLYPTLAEQRPEFIMRLEKVLTDIATEAGFEAQ
jgi:hypothetical protein